MKKEIIQAKIDLLALADQSPLAQAVCDIMTDLLQLVEEKDKGTLGFEGKGTADGPDRTTN